MRDISNSIPHLDDEEMIDLSLRVVDKLKVMSDEEFAKLEGDMNQMHKMINEYSTDLIDIANQYESTEQANQAIAGALATDVIK